MKWIDNGCGRTAMTPGGLKLILYEKPDSLFHEILLAD